MKDNFSAQAEIYARFRPAYPSSLFDYLNGLCLQKERAWDCATGNGQIAFGLSPFFREIQATDISEQQLSHALKAENIMYRKEAAESSSFTDRSFDLIVVAQAIHWFDFDLFYKEVKRTLKTDGVFVVTGYDMPKTDPETDDILMYFYDHTIGKYWDPERKYVDERYETIPFPFEEVTTPKLFYECTWNLEHFLGYVNTWSAVQHYIKDTKINPVPKLEEQLQKVWKPGDSKKVVFPVLLRAGTL